MRKLTPAFAKRTFSWFWTAAAAVQRHSRRDNAHYHRDEALDAARGACAAPWGPSAPYTLTSSLQEDLVLGTAFQLFKPSTEWMQLIRMWEGVKLGVDRVGEEGSVPIDVGPILEVLVISVCNLKWRRGPGLRHSAMVRLYIVTWGLA